MGANWCCNWRLTALKTIKMLIRPPHDRFKMTVRADCAVSAGNPLPPSIKALARVRGWNQPLNKSPSCSRSPASVAGIQIEANFPFHQPCLFIGFRAENSWIAVSKHNHGPFYPTPCWQYAHLKCWFSSPLFHHSHPLSSSPKYIIQEAKTCELLMRKMRHETITCTLSVLHFSCLLFSFLVSSFFLILNSILYQVVTWFQEQKWKTLLINFRAWKYRF